MGALKTVEVLRRFFSANPVTCTAAEIQSDVVHRLLPEMLSFRTSFTKHLADTFVGDWIKATIESGLVDHGDKCAVCEQRQCLPPHVIERSCRLVVIHAHTALDRDLVWSSRVGPAVELCIQADGERTEPPHAGLARDDDAGGLFDGLLECGYRTAGTYTFGGGVNEVQRAIIAMAGLRLPRSRR